MPPDLQGCPYCQASIRTDVRACPACGGALKPLRVEITILGRVVVVERLIPA